MNKIQQHLMCIFLIAHALCVNAHWRDWFLNTDQRAHHLLIAGDAAAAAKQFKDPRWKSAAQYKIGQYQEAEKFYQHSPHLEDRYNLGNIYAQKKQFTKAINAYNAVLKKQPQHADARYNLELIQKLQATQSQKSPQNKPPLDPKTQTFSEKNQSHNDENAHQKTQPSSTRFRSKQDSARATAKKIGVPHTHEKQAHQPHLTSQQYERALSNQQWLNRVSDDVPDLLKQKFLHDYLRRYQ